jgi:hypothetical protein
MLQASRPSDGLVNNSSSSVLPTATVQERRASHRIDTDHLWLALHALKRDPSRSWHVGRGRPSMEKPSLVAELAKQFQCTRAAVSWIIKKKKGYVAPIDVPNHTFSAGAPS